MTVALTDQIVAAMRAAFPPYPSEINSDDPLDSVAAFYGRMEYHLGWRDDALRPAMSNSGKLIRPLLAVLACRTLGGETAHALPLAAGLQLLHDFSLIHDDIEDHSHQRRGRQTVWSIWGLEQGINVGDGMFAIAHRSLHRLPDVGVDAATTLAVLRGFEEVILRICEGQHLDMTGEGHFEVTAQRYLETIRNKTAALVAGAAGLGARTATDDQTQVDAMTAFGEALGMAFQIQDDWLDIWGDPAQTGKPPAADLLQRKLSFPVIVALEAAAPADRTLFERLYRAPDLAPDDIQTLLAILERTGAQGVTTDLAYHYHRQAEEALGLVKPRDPAAFGELQGLVATLLNRTR